MRQEQCELLVAACHTRLEAAADPARAAEAAKFFPSNPPILGVPTGLTNTLGKELVERLKHDGSLDDIIAVAEALFASGIMEEGSCANTVLAAFWRRFMPQHWDTFERWLGLFNCWGTTDSFGLKVLGPLVLRDGPPSERLRTWSRSSHVWTRRASMVSLVPAARKGGHVDLILEITDALLADPQDAIQKAVGWMLKELCKGDVQAVVTYLAGRRECMARLAFRYASEKLTPAQKAWLLEQSAG
jgi:3-methyladenine DNA glycosylase AlkD